MNKAILLLQLEVKRHMNVTGSSYDNAFNFVTRTNRPLAQLANAQFMSADEARKTDVASLGISSPIFNDAMPEIKRLLGLRADVGIEEVKQAVARLKTATPAQRLPIAQSVVKQIEKVTSWPYSQAFDAAMTLMPELFGKASA